MLLLVATLATALFAGAAVYVSLVEHPARVSCGLDVALREFGPSNKRGAVMQASLALIGCVAGLAVGWQLGDGYVALASVLLGLLVPFTLIVILPTNKRLLAPTLDSRSSEAARLLTRWARLHAVRTVVSLVSLVVLLLRFRGPSAG
jgi:Domain of unknown function (DUF1772)